MSRQIDRIADKLSDLLRQIEDETKPPLERLKQVKLVVQEQLDELQFHDCEDMALMVQPSFEGVGECLELGLPLIIEKYGHSSDEAQHVRDLMPER